MTGFIASMKDTLLLVKTDKRIWSGGAFLFIVLGVWSMTGTWREPKPPVEPSYVKKERPKAEEFREAILDFQKDLEQNRRSRTEIKDDLARTQNELNSTNQKVDWTLNNLVGKLDGVSSKVTQLAEEIGTRKVRQTEIDRKIASQSKKRSNVAVPRKVDPGEL